MALYQQREQDLKEHIKSNFELQKNLEDQLRCAGDEKEKVKIKKDIKETKQSTTDYQNQLDSIVKESREALAREMPLVTFKELEVVTKFILGMSPISTEINFSLTNIKEKIAKNQLTEEVSSLLIMGMVKVKEVNRFIEHNTILRPDFTEKIKAGFIAEYLRLWKTGVKGDALFESLHQFSCGHSSNFKEAAAGLAVLSYLFEKCEVFEQ